MTTAGPVRAASPARPARVTSAPAGLGVAGGRQPAPPGPSTCASLGAAKVRVAGWVHRPPARSVTATTNQRPRRAGRHPVNKRPQLAASDEASGGGQGQGRLARRRPPLRLTKCRDWRAADDDEDALCGCCQSGWTAVSSGGALPAAGRRGAGDREAGRLRSPGELAARAADGGGCCRERSATRAGVDATQRWSRSR